MAVPVSSGWQSSTGASVPKERTREATAAGVATGALIWGKRSEGDFAHPSKYD